MTNQLPSATQQIKSRSIQPKATVTWPPAPLLLVGLTLAQHRLARLLTRRCTSFDSFIKLLKAQGDHPLKSGLQLFGPRFDQPDAFRCAELLGLARLYDRAQKARTTSGKRRGGEDKKSADV